MNKILNRLRALIEEKGWTYFYMEETNCIVAALEHSLVLFGVDEGRIGCRMVYKKEALPENREKLLADLAYSVEQRKAAQEPLLES